MRLAPLPALFTVALVAACSGGKGGSGETGDSGAPGDSGGSGDNFSVESVFLMPDALQVSINEDASDSSAYVECETLWTEAEDPASWAQVMGDFEPTPTASALAGQLGPRSFGIGEVEVVCDAATSSDCPLTLFSDEYTFAATESILVGDPSATSYTVEDACIDLIEDVRVAAARSTGGADPAPASPPPPFGDLPELTQGTGTTDMVVSSLVTGLALLKVPGLATLNANWVVLRPSGEANTNPNSLWIAMAIALRHGTSPTALTFTDCAGSAQVSIIGVGVKYANVNATKSKEFESFLNDPAGYLWNSSSQSFDNIPAWMSSPTELKKYDITIPSRVIYRQGTVKWWDSSDPTKSIPTVSGGASSTCTSAPWKLLEATAFIDPCGSAFANAPDLGEDAFSDNEADCPGEGLSLAGLDNAARWAAEAADRGDIDLPPAP